MRSFYRVPLDTPVSPFTPRVQPRRARLRPSRCLWRHRPGHRTGSGRLSRRGRGRRGKRPPPAPGRRLGKYREGQRPGGCGRRVARGEGTRRGRLYEGGYLGIPDKGPGAVEEVLCALGYRPRAGHGRPGDEEVREMQAGEEERHSGEEAPEGAGGPGDREEAQHDRER